MWGTDRLFLYPLETSGSHLGFQHLTRTREHRVQAKRACSKGTVLPHPGSALRANARLQWGQEGWTTNFPRKQSLVLDISKLFLVLSSGKNPPIIGAQEASSFNSLTNWWTSTRNMAAYPASCKQKAEASVSCLRSKAGNSQSQDFNPRGLFPWATVLVQLPWAI